jgi:hypothetical protein
MRFAHIKPSDLPVKQLTKSLNGMGRYAHVGSKDIASPDGNEPDGGGFATFPQAIDGVMENSVSARNEYQIGIACHHRFRCASPLFGQDGLDFPSVPLQLPFKSGSPFLSSPAT